MAKRQYEETFPKLQASNIDIVLLECHNAHVPVDLIELIGGKKVMVGAIDVASHAVETPEEVAATLRLAVQFVAVEKLYPSTNCWMAPLPGDVARGKLSTLRAGRGDGARGVGGRIYLSALIGTDYQLFKFLSWH